MQSALQSVKFLGGVGLFLSFDKCRGVVCRREYRFTRYGVINSFSKGILWIYVIQMGGELSIGADCYRGFLIFAID